MNFIFIVRRQSVVVLAISTAAATKSQWWISDVVIHNTSEVTEVTYLF